MRSLFLACAVLTACTHGSAGQGGAEFKSTAPAVLASSPEALFAVCWPADALATQRVTLTFVENEVLFEAKDGASNSTARCLREIASTVVWPKRPATLDVAPPSQPIDGWAVLSWVHLLAASRYTADRGVIDPAPLVAACGATRPSTSFVIRHTPTYELRAIPSAINDSERCIEAVLAATAWPSSRELFFTFENAHRPASGGDVQRYLAPTDSSTGIGIDPAQVKDALSLQAPKVSACWESALARRTAIGGGRTFRFRVDASGTVTRAWVAATMSDGPTAADYLLDGCLIDVIRGAHFPPRAGDGFYTWVFAQR